MEAEIIFRKKIIIILFSILIIPLIYLNLINKPTDLKKLVVENYDIQGIDSLRCNSSSYDFESIVEDKEKINEFFNFLSTIQVNENYGALSKKSKGFLLIKFYKNQTLALGIFIFDEKNIAIIDSSNTSIKYYKVNNLELNLDLIKTLYLE